MKKIFYFLMANFVLISMALAETNPLYIEQFPKQLKAESDAFFTLKSTEDFSLGNTNIIWKIDGVVFDKGIGRTTFKTKVPKQNVEKTLTAEIEIDGLTPFFISTPLRASPFVLLFEGKDSITPAFYKGRKLPGKEGAARIGVIVQRSGYQTEFTVNGTKTISSNNLIISNGRITENTLEVSARVLENLNTIAQLEKSIPLAKPETYLFRENPDTGFKRQISGNETGKEIYVEVEPYFFFGKNKYDSKLRYVWRLGGDLKNVTEPWYIKISSDKNNSLQAELEVKQVEKITQRAEKLFNIIFN